MEPEPVRGVIGEIVTEPKSGVVSSEFYITIITALGCVAGGIILLCQGKTEQGINLLLAAAGVGSIYTGARSFVKR